MRTVSEKKYVPPAKRLDGPFDDYEVREALKTLSDAYKIKKNKKLMRAVRAEVSRQQKDAQEIFKSTGEK